MKCTICGDRSTYAYPLCEPSRCGLHKESCQVQIYKKCEIHRCQKAAKYGVLTPIRCEMHKSPYHTAIALYSKPNYNKGPICTCGKRAYYRLHGRGPAVYCRDCRPNDDFTDAVHRICVKCKTRASYGPPDTTVPLTCGKHKEPEYECLTNKKCVVEGCKKTPKYSVDGIKAAEYCELHAEHDHVKK